ncbi:hypothetical protein P3W55_05125 [Pseudomonas citronellolis]|uniref:DUF2570 domain-containing protein n=1 Tax=Pseudomonas citronellolis TaxID=53408 RepID=A0AAW6P1Y9_9PSED|nr:hypothetical protein [Pseudomonas citronellolis]MDF3841089.1 hypothetical protein [Pseudomonas citronellolis]
MTKPAAMGLGLLLLLLSWAAAGTGGYLLGRSDGLAAATSQCQKAQLADLQAVIDSAKGLTASANEASQELGKTISDRKQADAKATKEIRDALKATAGQRTACVFDDGVMQQLEDARKRAADAAAGGIRSAVPAAH